jgi:hypothetical protein
VSTTDSTPAFEPFLIHALGAVTVHVSQSSTAGAVTLAYGQELLVTEEVVEANRDRLGRVRLLELLDDEAAQVAAWRSVRLRRGPWPEMSRLQPGSFEYEDAFERARQAAHRIDDPDERRAALARVRSEYVTSPTSRTLCEFRPSRG